MSYDDLAQEVTEAHAQQSSRRATPRQLLAMDVSETRQDISDELQKRRQSTELLIGNGTRALFRVQKVANCFISGLFCQMNADSMRRRK
jgi:hypothetical protein